MNLHINKGVRGSIRISYRSVRRAKNKRLLDTEIVSKIEQASASALTNHHLSFTFGIMIFFQLPTSTNEMF